MGPWLGSCSCPVLAPALLPPCYHSASTLLLPYYCPAPALLLSGSCPAPALLLPCSCSRQFGSLYHHQHLTTFFGTARAIFYGINSSLNIMQHKSHERNNVVMIVICLICWIDTIGAILSCLTGDVFRAFFSFFFRTLSLNDLDLHFNLQLSVDCIFLAKSHILPLSSSSSSPSF